MLRAASSADGAVVGPSSATDNAIVRFDATTGKLVQNSVATISDAGVFNIPLSTAAYFVNPSNTAGFYGRTGSNATIYANSTDVAEGSSSGLNINALLALGWGSSAVATPDTFLFRDAANTLAQRNGTTAQAFRVYNTYTDASNYERLNVEWGANVGKIYTAKNGTGASRDIYVGTDGAGSLYLTPGNILRWKVDGTSGHFLANVDNTYDIGAFGATRPRNVYVGTDLIANRILSSTFEGPSKGDLTAVSDGVWRFRDNAGTSFNRIQLGGTTSSFPAIKRNGTALNFRLADDSADAGVTASQFTSSATDFLHVTSGTLASGAAASVGTLTNAPAAGNPTKWVAINDNGTTRYIPAW